MNDIIARMYGGLPLNNNASKSAPLPASQDGPLPASQGGPTAMELAISEGYADENGMLDNGMHSIISAMYGGGIQKITGGQQLNPDYQAGSNGKTVGGVGDTDAWGNPRPWSSPQTDKLNEGEIHSTPAGDYKVEKNPWGQFVLVPQGDALKSTGPYLTNMTAGQHHLGINPNTGEVWYQSAPTNTARGFSETNESYQARLDQIAEEQATTGEEKDADTESYNSSRQYVGGALSSSPFAAAPLRKLGFLQPKEKPQYMKMLNEALMGSLFKDLI
jgi:hypothetical protein